MGAYLDQQAQLAQMQDAASDMLAASNDVYVSALTKRYDEFMRRVTADAQALRINVMEQAGTSTPTYADYLRFQGDAKMAKALQDELVNLNQTVNTNTLDDLQQIYKDSYNLNAWSLDEVIPPNLDINYKMPTDLVIKQFVSQGWNGSMFSQNIGAINDMMAREIQNQVAQAMLSGDSSANLATRISGIIGTPSNGYVYRAKMIATTQLNQSANLARNQVWDDNEDVIDDWIWASRSLGSMRLCEDCAERSGHTYDEVKDIADDQDLPFDPGYVHPFCACTWMPKVKTWDQLLPPGVTPLVGPTAMLYPAQNGVAMKVTPMKFADWSDRYLSENEKGDL